MSERKPRDRDMPRTLPVRPKHCELDNPFKPRSRRRSIGMRAANHVAAVCSAGLVLFGAGFVLGQMTVPTDYHLVSEDVLAVIDLANEIDSVQNRELRLSRAVVSPGGHIGLHSHQGDPTIVYL